VSQLQKIIEGLREVPAKVDINVIPVQDEEESISKIEKNRAPIDIKPSVEQG